MPSPKNSESSNDSLRSTLKQLKKFVEEKDVTADPCECTECGECVQAACSRDEAPVVTKHFNAIYTKLPGCLSFAFPVPRCDSVAKDLVVDEEKCDVPDAEKIATHLDALIKDLKDNGYSYETLSNFYETFTNLPNFPADPKFADIAKLGPALYQTVLINSIKAMENDQSSVSETIEYILERFGSGIANVRPINYYVKLPTDACHWIKLEYPLKWVTTSLIAKINQKLAEHGTIPYVGIFGNGNKGCNNEVEITNDPLTNTNTGVIRIHVKLHVDSQEVTVKNYADTKLVQNVGEYLDNDRRDNCAVNNDVIFDFEFYFFVFGRQLIGGIVFLSNGARDYGVLSILPNYGNEENGVTSNKYRLSSVSLTSINSFAFSGRDSSLDPAADQRVLYASDAINYVPAFTPAILLAFVPTCNTEECDKAWMLVNETSINL